ncbi:helix-turn-helix domain-containing protein, partial [Vibrio splendidus]
MLDLIKIFDQVVESGSFSKAAQALNMAPSSVARNIDNLESKIKSSLF